jgi:hypothetical protein
MALLSTLFIECVDYITTIFTILQYHDHISSAVIFICLLFHHMTSFSVAERVCQPKPLTRAYFNEHSAVLTAADSATLVTALANAGYVRGIIAV